MDKETVCLMKKEQFKKWLISQGYSERTPSGHPSTAYDYPNRIDKICDWENITWETLAKNITTILSQYDTGGAKEIYGKKSNSAFINALKRFSEFLVTDSKSPLKKHQASAEMFSSDEFKNKIYNFVASFYEYVTEKTGNKIYTQQKNVLKKGIFIKGVELFAGSSIEFYETWNNKASYLILYFGTEPVLELQLTRILFNNDNTITWYLRNPSSPNKVLYEAHSLKLIKLPHELIEQIKQQQKAYDGNNYDYDDSREIYEFVVKVAPNAVFEKLFLLLIKRAVDITEVNPQPRPEKKEVPSSYEYPTDAILREIAVQNADYKCEYDNSHSSFTCKSTNKQYMEGHHLIPMGKQDEFANKLDISANIFSLCPNCHRIVHYGILDEKKPILDKLFNKRKAVLQNFVPEINFEKLVNLYL